MGSELLYTSEGDILVELLGLNLRVYSVLDEHFLLSESASAPTPTVIPLVLSQVFAWSPPDITATSTPTASFTHISQEHYLAPLTAIGAIPIAEALFAFQAQSVITNDLTASIPGTTTCEVNQIAEFTISEIDSLFTSDGELLFESEGLSLNAVFVETATPVPVTTPVIIELTFKLITPSVTARGIPYAGEPVVTLIHTLSIPELLCTVSTVIAPDLYAFVNIDSMLVDSKRRITIQKDPRLIVV
jgi:hypothetical protein